MGASVSECGFEDYLTRKRIDASLFKEKEGALYMQWERTFLDIHPRSFTAQKLFLINQIRRKYTLTHQKTVAKVD